MKSKNKGGRDVSGGKRDHATPFYLVASHRPLLLREGCFPQNHGSERSVGLCWMMVSKTLAGPVGVRRPCSQFWTVLTLTPISEAKFPCERERFSRIPRTSWRSTTKRREGSFVPLSMSRPSRTLSRSRLKSWLFMLVCLHNGSQVCRVKTLVSRKIMA